LDPTLSSAAPLRSRSRPGIPLFALDDDPPIQGDPETLLPEWLRKLALPIGADGEIAPAN
jgi:hypothetical protein